MASQSSTFSERLWDTFKKKTLMLTTAETIAQEIASNKAYVCIFLDELGVFVKSEDVDTRKYGIEMFLYVLERIPKSFLNESEISLIIIFYCGQLKDQNIGLPILQGLLNLVQMCELPQDAVSHILSTIFEHVHCSSQSQQHRNIIYSIISTLLETRLSKVKEMGLEFITGFIQAMDGEPDPRNLILLFDILPRILTEIPLHHLTEEMFEVISCYFPIDFYSSGTGIFNVTREDLSSRLAACLGAIPEFAEFCLPLIIEKLSSNYQIAKMDSLNLLCSSAKTFQVAGLKDHLLNLWPLLQKEIMSPKGTKIMNHCFKAVAAITSVISKDEPVCEAFINNIIDDIKSSLCDVQLNSFVPTRILLETIASVNKKCCIIILRVVIPLCLGQYSIKTVLADKLILMDTLNSFLSISSNHGFAVNSVPELAWTDMPQIYVNELNTKFIELRLKVLIGLKIQRTHLTNSQLTKLNEVMFDEIDTGHEEVRTVCYNCLSEFAVIYPEEILRFVKTRYQYDSNILCTADTQLLSRRLQALSAIVKTSELVNEILPQIIAIAYSADKEMSFVAFMCLEKLFAKGHIDNHIKHFLLQHLDVISSLKNLQISTCDNRLGPILAMCRSLIRLMSPEEQQLIVNNHNLLTDKISEWDMIFIMNLFIPMRQSILSHMDVALFEHVYNIAIESCNLNLRQTACKFLCVVLNKMDDSKAVEKFGISHMEERVNILKSNADINIKKASVRLLLWLTKAVVARGSNISSNMLDILCKVLNITDVGEFAAQEYKTLVIDTEDGLTEKNHCYIQLFYKQLIFEHLIKQNHTVFPVYRENYLVAMIQVSEEVPVNSLILHSNNLVSLLIESLSLSNEQCLFLALTILNLLMDSQAPIASDVMKTFISKLLKLCSYKTMRLRIVALNCLRELSNYASDVTVLHKQDVLDGLASVIDDQKRLVRKSAVQTRSFWFMVGESEEVDQK